MLPLCTRWVSVTCAWMEGPGLLPSLRNAGALRMALQRYARRTAIKEGSDVATKDQESAVRSYLQALKDPDSLRDDKAVNELERKLNRTSDPLERVKLRGQLDRARRIDPAVYEEGFVAHAKQWAEEHGVTAEAFKAEGVSDEVLARAGLDGGRRRSRAASSRSRTRVSRDDVRATIRQHRSFTLPQIKEKTGASRETVRAVIKELTDAGEVERAGSDESHSGRGRAPTAYRRA